MELTDAQKKSIAKYKMFGIDFEINEDVVKVSQNRNINGYFLNQNQLHKRARAIFPTEKIQCNVFSLDVLEITMQWIEERMEEFGIKRNDLIKQLALDKSYLSLLFASEDNPRKIQLSRPMKALFYYYFLTYELNRDFRKALSE